LMVGDFNGDGIPDLLTIDRSRARLRVLFGNGDGTFQVGPTTDLPFGPSTAVVGGFNNDGIPDLAIAFPEDEVLGQQTTVSVLLANGDGTFQAPLVFDVGVGPTSLAVGDFNNDGFPDLAVANLFSNDVSVLLNAGDSAPSPADTGALKFLEVLPFPTPDFALSSPTFPAAETTPTGAVDSPLARGAVDHVFVSQAREDDAFAFSRASRVARGTTDAGWPDALRMDGGLDESALSVLPQ
jgi:hypothetical protein